MIRKLLCAIGWHKWIATFGHIDPTNHDYRMADKIHCRHCRKDITHLATTNLKFYRELFRRLAQMGKLK